MEKENTKYLTSMRGLACLTVVFAHILASIPNIGVNASGCGKIGVWLFFILSAFLLTTQWLNKDKIEIRDIIKFYIKRVLRIYPCYIVVLIVSFLIGYITDIDTIIKHIFLQEGIGHFWTIPVEFYFYLVVPIIFFIIKKINNNKYSIIFLVLLFIITALAFPYTQYQENSIELKWYLPVFILGMILAFIYKANNNKAKSKIVYDIIVVLIILGIIISIPYFRYLLFNIEPDNYLQNKYLFFSIAWAIMILAIQNSKYIIKILNKSKIMFWIGKISFPLYLIHYIVLNKLNINNILIKSISVLIISIVLSIIMHILIEKPMLNVSKMINNKL